MRIYLAACYTSNFGKTGTIYAKLTDQEKYHRDKHPYILESYHYIHKSSFVERLRTEKQRVFLDSGAFSAFTKGVEIDIPAYCEYVKTNWDIIEEIDGRLLFSVLDKISLTDRGASAQGTKENQLTMEEWFRKNGCKGVQPLPCFHYGEPERYLEWYIANYPYITLGGMVPIPTGKLGGEGGNSGLYAWLDRMWDRYLTDGAGRPRVKVHGFGLTTVDLMTRYPWASVDSSSWVQIAVHGNILLPDHGAVAISSDSPRVKQHDYHYDTMAPAHREAIKRQIEAQGFTVERLKASAYSRWSFNFAAFHEINRRVNEKISITFKAEQPVLFA